MTAKSLAAAAVILAAGGIIGVKAARQHPAEDAAVKRSAIPSVVLIADPREADSECGCGQIIRRVRDAKARGVTVHESGPADPAVARYGVTVAPTVLILGADGRVVARHEGESSDALAAVSADLAVIEGQKR